LLLVAGCGTQPPGEPREVTNTLGMNLVLIPRGEFLMGSPETDKDADENDKPQHRVEITQRFYMAVHPVTVGQFRQFVEDTKHKDKKDVTEPERDGMTSIKYAIVSVVARLPGLGSVRPPVTLLHPETVGLCHHS
jgi:formylglycine-generating enzyme required for sulfatase activity